MSLYTAVRHHRVHLRRQAGPVRADQEHVGFNGRLAAVVTRRIGSMWTVYICTGVTVVWMVLGSDALIGFDPYPYPLLLFVGNVVQLLLIFVILLGQQVLRRVEDRRARETFEDAEAILHDCEQIQNHLIAQDTHLASCITLDDQELLMLQQAGSEFDPRPTPDDEQIGRNGRFAAWITMRVGTTTAFYLAVAFQVGWIVLAGTGLLGIDHYPFPFLLFLSSLAQQLLMFVLMVGQHVMGRTADRRALLTYLDAEAVLHACERLQTHLLAQDLAIQRVVDHMRECAVER